MMTGLVSTCHSIVLSTIQKEAVQSPLMFSVYVGVNTLASHKQTATLIARDKCRTGYVKVDPGTHSV